MEVQYLQLKKGKIPVEKLRTEKWFSLHPTYGLANHKTYADSSNIQESQLESPGNLYFAQKCHKYFPNANARSILWFEIQYVRKEENIISNIQGNTTEERTFEIVKRFIHKWSIKEIWIKMINLEAWLNLIKILRKKRKRDDKRRQKDTTKKDVDSQPILGCRIKVLVG